MSDVTDDMLTAAVVALARANIPPDIQELLLYGNPSLSVPPKTLNKALAVAIIAERERCAATVEAIGSDTDPQLADHLANCLRNLPQTPPLLSQEEAFQRAVKAGMWNGLVSKPEDAA